MRWDFLLLAVTKIVMVKMLTFAFFILTKNFVALLFVFFVVSLLLKRAMWDARIGRDCVREHAELFVIVCVCSLAAEKRPPPTKRGAPAARSGPASRRAAPATDKPGRTSARKAAK